MNLFDYGITTLSSTALTGALAWVLKEWISVRLTSSVKREVEVKLEQAKSEFRMQEEGLKAELRARGAQMEVLQSGIVGQLSARQTTRCQRQFEAIEMIWDAVISMSPQKFAARMMQSIKFDYAIEQAPTDPRVREMFAHLRKTCDFSKSTERPSNISRARLYVSPLTWSLYEAYATILGFASTKMLMLESGMDAVKMFKTQEIVEMAKAALPHQSQFIDQYGLSGLDFLVDELEGVLLQTLQKEIAGVEDDMSAASRASTILGHVARAHVQ